MRLMVLLLPRATLIQYSTVQYPSCCTEPRVDGVSTTHVTELSSIMCYSIADKAAEAQSRDLRTIALEKERERERE